MQTVSPRTLLIIALAIFATAVLVHFWPDIVEWWRFTANQPITPTMYHNL